jgi:hypothetical protein
MPDVLGAFIGGRVVDIGGQLFRFRHGRLQRRAASTWVSAETYPLGALLRALTQAPPLPVASPDAYPEPSTEDTDL